MKQIKNHLSQLFCGFIMMSFLIGGSYLASARDNTRFFLQTISGEPAVMDGVRIQGLLNDWYSGSVFRLEQDQAASEIIIYNTMQQHWQSTIEYNAYDSILADRLHTSQGLYEIGMARRGHPAAAYGENTIWIRKRTGKRTYYKRIPVDVTTARDSSHVHMDLYWSAIMPYMHEKNGVLYFIVPTDDSFRGESGLYAVSEFDRRERDEPSVSGYQKLLSIDLEGGAVQVKGLYPVENSLVVITERNQKLCLQAYHLSTASVSEIKVIPPTSADETRVSVRGFAQGDVLTLLIHHYGGLTAYTYKIAKDTELLNTVSIPHPDSGSRIQDMLYHKGNLIVLLETAEFPLAGPADHPVRFPEYYLDILAYNASGNTVYEGRVHSDINDDHLWQRRSDQYADMQDRPYIERRYAQPRLRKAGNDQ